MPPEPSGTVYRTASGYGIRWPEDGRRYRRAGFATKTEARRWFAENVAPRLSHRRPSPELAFDAFCDVFLKRHGATVAPATKRTLEERLAPARAAFADWTLRELEGAASDIAAWRSDLPDGSRYRLTSAFRQALAAAVRWGYIVRNPAADAGKNPQPRAEELQPFTAEEIDALAAELGPAFGPLVVFAAETGLRTNEWTALERRDIDREGRAVTVHRRYADGIFTPYPKTVRSRRRVPLSARAWEAIEALPPRLDTPLLFPATEGGPIGLDTWRTRAWYPALDAAGIDRRGPYHLWHTFATEALAGRYLDLRAWPPHGDEPRHDRPHVWTPGPRLGGVDSGSLRCKGRAFRPRSGHGRRGRGERLNTAIPPAMWACGRWSVRDSNS
jgi:integrase